MLFSIPTLHKLSVHNIYITLTPLNSALLKIAKLVIEQFMIIFHEYLFNISYNCTRCPLSQFMNIEKWTDTCGIFENLTSLVCGI